MTPAGTMQPNMNWYSVLAHHAIRTPDKAMTICNGTTTTYSEMVELATASANGLADHGVRAGDVVALLSYNCPEFLETLFAANYLGAIAMPINWRLAGPEVRYILEHSGARPSSATGPWSTWRPRRRTVSRTSCCGPASRGKDRPDGHHSPNFVRRRRWRTRLQPKPATSTG